MKMCTFGFSVVFLFGLAGFAAQAADDSKPNVDWNQWGGSSMRNNTPVGHNIPTEWNIGEFDYRTGAWDSSKAKNIKWVARLGSQSYGSPVVARRARVYWHEQQRGLAQTLSVRSRSRLLALFRCRTMESFSGSTAARRCRRAAFTTGRLQGVCSTPLVEGNRLWFVTNRCEVRCLDTEGFYDGKNDGPVRKRGPITTKDEADVIWVFDMFNELGVSPHNMSDCSVTSAGDILFVCTSNGIDEAHTYIPAPRPPASSH